MLSSLVLPAQHSVQLPPRRHALLSTRPGTPFRSTILGSPFAPDNIHRNPFRINTYEKLGRGRGRVCGLDFLRPNQFVALPGSVSAPLFSVPYALFRFPYALSPLFATYENCRVYPDSSRSGTEHPTRMRVLTWSGRSPAIHSSLLGRSAAPPVQPHRKRAQHQVSS
jgi:hypothetical protein